jgi:hypothetical protein
MKFKTFAISAALVGGATAGGVHFQLWDRYAPAWLQEKVGFGLLGSPQAVARAMEPDAGPVATKIRDVAVGKTVHWKLRVFDVKGGLLGGRSTIVTFGGKDVKVRVSFKDAEDAKKLTEGQEIRIEGTLKSIDKDELIVEDATLVR